MQNLKTYSWSSVIGFHPFEIKVFATSPENARKQVLHTLEEIAQVKPRHTKLNEEHMHCEKRQALREELLSQVHADFFEGCFAPGAFDYTGDTIVGLNQKLIDFLKTEPKCSGPVHMVSFRSCLDG